MLTLMTSWKRQGTDSVQEVPVPVLMLSHEERQLYVQCPKLTSNILVVLFLFAFHRPFSHPAICSPTQLYLPYNRGTEGLKMTFWPTLYFLPSSDTSPSTTALFSSPCITENQWTKECRAKSRDVHEEQNRHTDRQTVRHWNCLTTFSHFFQWHEKSGTYFISGGS